jgi:preprotein translocase subunit SecB
VGGIILDENTYKQFIKDIEIQDIFLSNIESKRHVIVFNTPSESNVNVEFNPKFIFDHIENDKFISKAIFEVLGKTNQEKLFSITCEFTVINYISTPELMKEEFINEYIERNLPLITWPYGREIINSTTTRMGFPPLILGNHKVV